MSSLLGATVFVGCSSQTWNAKLQKIMWLESTNRIQVITWHFSFYWWIQVTAKGWGGGSV